MHMQSSLDYISFFSYMKINICTCSFLYVFKGLALKKKLGKFAALTAKKTFELSG